MKVEQCFVRCAVTWKSDSLLTLQESRKCLGEDRLTYLIKQTNKECLHSSLFKLHTLKCSAEDALDLGGHWA